MRRDSERRTEVLLCPKTEKTKWKSLQATVKEQQENLFIYLFFRCAFAHGKAEAVQLIHCVVSVEGGGCRLGWYICVC